MLFLLSLFATALAAPQIPYYGYTAYHPYAAYSAFPAYQAFPAYPGLYTPQQAVTYQNAVPDASGRTIVSVGNFRELTGDFEASTTSTPPRTITGNFVIQQNPLLDVVTSNEAKMNLYVRSTADLNNAELRVRVAVGTTCDAAIATITGDVAAVPASPGPAADAVIDTTNGPVLATLTGPIFQINGFYINGRTMGHNIDGTNGQTALTGAMKWLLIQEGPITTGTPNIIGCSMAAL